MIGSLYIKNFAIFSEVNINFNSGLTVITGETGAGKSLIVKSLSYVLGGKGNKVLVSSGSTRSVVEAVTPECTVRRILSKSGRSKSYINDEPVKESLVKDSLPIRADFHGQHDQQRILNPQSHLNYLDRFSGHIDLVSELKKTYKNIIDSEKELDRLIQNKSEAKTKQELLEYQTKEIESISPKVDEDNKLLNQLKKLSNSETLFKTIQDLICSLETNERSLVNHLQEDLNILQDISRMDSELKTYADELSSIQIAVQELSNQLMSYQGDIETDPETCEALDERLRDIETLKRKYGGSIESVLNRLVEIKSSLSDLSSDGEKINILKTEIEELKKSYRKDSIQLHSARKDSAKKLESLIEIEMKKLNIPKPRFRIQFDIKEDNDSFLNFEEKQVKITDTGFDSVTFYLSTNPGEDLKPLTDIASGGEISRIMLSIKTVLQTNDPAETLIFDEIDSGISGETAEKVSQALSKLSEVKQVICITHLPQIASRANHHLHISKMIKDEQTKVDATYLNKDERISVISRLYGRVELSGEMEESYRSLINTDHG